MDLSKILTITGKSGLYKVISSTQSSLVAESLDDGKRIPVFASSRSSTLEDISIFTKSEDVPLKDVLWKMHEAETGKKSSVDHKADNESLKDYFEKIVPDYDKERVYPSDIKKVIKWYNTLLEHNMITKPDKEEDKEESDEKTDAKGQKPEQTKRTKVKPIKKDISKLTDSKASQKSQVKNIKTKKV